MPNLQFLAIFNNKLLKIESLKHSKLKFLDAHNNHISEVDTGVEHIDIFIYVNVHTQAGGTAGDGDGERWRW